MSQFNLSSDKIGIKMYHSFINCISCGANILNGQTNCPYCQIRLTYTAPDPKQLEWLHDFLKNLSSEIYNKFGTNDSIKKSLSLLWFSIPILFGIFGYITTLDWLIGISLALLLSPVTYILYSIQKESAEYYESEIIQYAKKEILPTLNKELEARNLSQNDLIEAIRNVTSRKDYFAHSNLCYLIYES
ncbi:MAG TPA: hypothetical protein PK079_12615 [Leptospiraceae bacterium]|nr:hypothetical protein [Leptospiraceae bacterium]HMW06917.1 hypothetical protein [Leptospiraceae bacterium]HMX32279.1 hypothetical protein [Leptospiraceae bacterium]HMY33447.1 hypothetical protein [Leptospiraceae bacterium]HMZ65481.1 hypothetical protein [Leptospiraceae bacterium]